MIMNPEDLSQLQTIINSSQSILILTGENPNLDNLGASLTCYLGFSRMGKTSSVACPSLPTVGLSHLVGIDKVQSDLGGQNLIVSFPYAEGSIEKVSYNIEDNQFNLIIQPHTGSPTLSAQAVKFSQGGANADLIIILGTPDLSNLGALYEKAPDLFSRVPLVVIDCSPENRRYGKINFVSPGFSSTSEIVGLLFEQMGLDLDPDMAHNLLVGIDFATQNFSLPTTSAEAFEVAARCLKAGARRASANVITREEKKEVKKAAKVFNQVLKRGTQDEEAPPDWLTPKIYKGTSLT